MIRNDTDEDYKNLDIAIVTGHGIFKTKELTNIGCKCVPSDLIHGKLEFADRTQAPIGPDVVSNRVFYHIRCDILPRHSTVEVLMALGDIDAHSAPIAEMITVKGQYDGGFRTRHINTVIHLEESYATR